MKTLKTLTIALAAMMVFAACGNAGAQNDKKKDNAPKAVKELNAESFTEKVFDMNSEDLVFLGDRPAIVAQQNLRLYIPDEKQHVLFVLLNL